MGSPSKTVLSAPSKSAILLTEAYAYYLAFAPAGSELAELAGAAGLRWTIEECFQRAKEELGLDHCEARSWHGFEQVAESNALDQSPFRLTVP